MGRLQMTSVRDAECFWSLKMFLYLFVIIFSQGKRFCWWWVQTIHYIWKPNTMLGTVMLNKSRKKSKRTHGKGSRAVDGAKAKMHQKSWKSLLIEHNALPWNQTCCSQFSHPWTDTHWCCRRHCSHVCSPYTNTSECSTFFFFLPGPSWGKVNEGYGWFRAFKY